MSALKGPFSGNVKTPPSPTAADNEHSFDTKQLNQPEDTSVVKTILYVEADSVKNRKPAHLETPFETDFRPGIGRT